MAEHQEQPSNEDLVPELADEIKVRLAQAYDTYFHLLGFDPKRAEQTLLSVVTAAEVEAAQRYMTVLRVRKAAAKKGFRVGV